MSKSTGKTLFALSGLFMGTFNPQWFGMGAAGTVSWASGLYGASLMSSIWTATHSSSNTSYSFNTAQNTIGVDSMIPIIYGTRKWAGGRTKC